jgi:hypothetical protein
MSETMRAWVFWAAYFVVPFVVALVVRRGYRALVRLGLPAAAIEWVLAYYDNMGGESGSGLELAFGTGLLALVYFLPLWLAGVCLSGALGRRFRTRSLNNAAASR